MSLCECGLFPVIILLKEPRSVYLWLCKKAPIISPINFTTVIIIITNIIRMSIIFTVVSSIITTITTTSISFTIITIIFITTTTISSITIINYQHHPHHHHHHHHHYQHHLHRHHHHYHHHQNYRECIPSHNIQIGVCIFSSEEGSNPEKDVSTDTTEQTPRKSTWCLQ
uniref:protein BEAN1-like n=1 Tax=Halichoerus grypus TaxID=9711 RepID=UPI001658C4E1|nr:protein BEAN1-like [Halichoerus grypus]